MSVTAPPKLLPAPVRLIAAAPVCTLPAVYPSRDRLIVTLVALALVMSVCASVKLGPAPCAVMVLALLSRLLTPAACRLAPLVIVPVTVAFPPTSTLLPISVMPAAVARLPATLLPAARLRVPVALRLTLPRAAAAEVSNSAAPAMLSAWV